MRVSNRERDRELFPLFLCIVCVIMIFQVTCIDARGDFADDIFLTVKEQYPGEIRTLRLYGASETDLKAFISAFENSVTHNESITKDNFDGEAAKTIMILYLDGEHLNVFDAVFNGWNLNVEDLINAMSNGGPGEVMAMLPTSFSVIAKMVKEILVDTVWIGEVRGMLVLPERADFSGFSVFLDGNNNIIPTIESGEFILSRIPEGEHQIVFRHGGFLCKKVILNVKRGQINDIGELTMIWGDFNVDNTVDIYDLVSLAKVINLNHEPGSGKEVFDYNLDGIINMYDFYWLAVNYGRKGD